MIKVCDCALVKPLSMILMSSTYSGIFPDIWKKSKPILVHKKGEKH